VRIVDASILVGVLLGHTRPSRAVLAAAGDHPLDPFHCPALVEAETLNAIRSLERGRKISREIADGAAAQLAETRMVHYAFGAVRERAWALRHNLSIYDASYLALAELLDGSVLLTADAGLASIARASLGEARVELVA
jgi:predicted nucleic acid-binding protein